MRELDLFNGEPTLDDLIAGSVALLRKHEPPEGYYGCFSGGKDSIVIKQLALEAGVQITWHYNVTTIDPPELVRYIKAEHPGVIWVRSKHGNFFRRLEERGIAPTRRVRWCCGDFKERNNPPGAVLVLGIRSEESRGRALWWSPVGTHRQSGSKTICPIIHWASDEVWEYIRDRRLPYCSLYNEGFHRLGCVGCPVASRENHRKELDRWPGYERRWRLSFKRIWERRAGTLMKHGREWLPSRAFADWGEWWDWWVSHAPVPKICRGDPQGYFGFCDEEEMR